MARESIEDLTAVLQDKRTIEAANQLTSALLSLTSAGISLGREFAGLGDQIAVNLAALTGDLTLEDRLRQEIKDVERALEGGFSTPIKYLFTTDEELNKELADLQAKLSQFEPVVKVKVEVPKVEVPQIDPALSLAPKKTGKRDKRDLSADEKSALSDLESLYDSTRTAAEKYEIQVARLQELSKTYGLEQEVYNRAIQQYAETLREADPALKEFNDLQAEAAQLFEETRTPLENLYTDYERLQELLESGAISFDTYKRAVIQSAEGFGELETKGKEATENLSVFADQAARNMQDAFADFLFDPFDEGIQGMLTGFLKVIQRMAAEQAAAAIFDSKSAGGLGLADLFKSGINALWCHARGQRDEPELQRAAGIRDSRLRKNPNPHLSGSRAGLVRY